MFQKIFHCTLEHFRAVLEFTKRRIAIAAKQSAHDAGFMAMIYTWPSFQRGEICCTYCALMVLQCEHFFVLLNRYAVGVFKSVAKQSALSFFATGVSVIHRDGGRLFDFFARLPFGNGGSIRAFLTGKPEALWPISSFVKLGNRLADLTLRTGNQSGYDAFSHAVYTPIVNGLTRLARKFAASVRAVSIIPQNAIHSIQFHQLCVSVSAAPPHSYCMRQAQGGRTWSR